MRQTMFHFVSRKALSLVVLSRCRPEFEAFLPASQSGFRQGRSTGDCVWAPAPCAQRRSILTSSSTCSAPTCPARLIRFREASWEIVRDIVDEDELALIQLLLEGTSAKVRVENTLSDPFDMDIGSPQGDGRSCRSSLTFTWKHAFKWSDSAATTNTTTS